MRRLMFAAAMLVTVSIGARVHAQGAEAEHEKAQVAAGEGDKAAATGEAPAEDPSRDFNFFGGIPFSYKNYDAKGGPLGDGKLGDKTLPAGEEEEPMSAPFILLLGNFALLLILLAKVGGPIARKTAEGRSDQIKGALDEAAKLRDAAQAKLDEYGAKLKSAESEIDAMVKGMRADAEADKARIIAAAEAQAAHTKREAELSIKAEIERARAMLAREVAIAATTAAAAMITRSTTPADQARLVDTFIKDVGPAAAARETV